MDLYSEKSKSIPQKTFVIFVEIVLLITSYWILFDDGGDVIFNWLGIKPLSGNSTGRTITFVFSLIVFVRLTFMMLYLLKRKISWDETSGNSMAFAIYFIGFPLLVYNRESGIDWLDYFAIALFVVGSCLNSISEIQRHFWKKKPENKGKLFTSGLFRYSMHINYFGDVLWVSAYAIITRNVYSIIIPVMLFAMFALWNIPALDKHLKGNYKDQFEEYKKKTKKFIPLIY